MSAKELLSVSALQKTFIPPHITTNEWTELALAIHRGRDHGIKSYIHALDICDSRYTNNDMSNITFDTLSTISNIPEEHITSLRDIYQ